MNPYILTYSGLCVSRTQGAPSIVDVAVSLSRLPRFAGHGRRWWSVLDHSLLVHDMAAQQTVWCETDLEGILLRLHALLHDAHECLTGDVPTPFKVAQLKSIQHQGDARLFAALVPEHADMPLDDLGKIAVFDRRALLAEALCVGPPSLKTEKDVDLHFGAEPYENDVALLTRGIGMQYWGFGPLYLEQNERHPGVRRFIHWYNTLRRLIQNEPEETALGRTLSEHRRQGMSAI